MHRRVQTPHHRVVADVPAQRVEPHHRDAERDDGDDDDHADGRDQVCEAHPGARHGRGAPHADERHGDRQKQPARDLRRELGRLLRVGRGRGDLNFFFLLELAMLISTLC